MIYMYRCIGRKIVFSKMRRTHWPRTISSGVDIFAIRKAYFLHLMALKEIIII